MRLIDADAVSAEIEKLLYPAPNRDSILYNCGVNDALNVIDDAETIDAVPVVRCKDCKYSNEGRGRHNKKIFVCRGREGLFRIVEENESCSSGERRKPNDPDKI